MSSVGDIGGNTRVVRWVESWVVHYFSNFIKKPTGKEYCLKLGKELIFEVIYTSYLIFGNFPWIFEFRVILELFPEQIQNPGIFRTQDTLRTLSIYHVKV